MATQKFANNFDTTVAATFGAGDTFLQLASVTGLPTLANGDWMTLTVYKLTGVEESAREVVKVTAIVGNQATVQRSYEGAAAAQFEVGDRVSARWSAKAAELKADQSTVDTKLSKTTDDTITATLTLAGASNKLAAIITNMAEKVGGLGSSFNTTINIDVSNNSILYITSNATANWLINLRGDASNTLYSLTSVGQAITVALMVAQGSTPYLPTVFQIDGFNITPKWQGGVAPSSGNASSIDVYVMTLIRTASGNTNLANNFQMFASQSQFK